MGKFVKSKRTFYTIEYAALETDEEGNVSLVKGKLSGVGFINENKAEVLLKKEGIIGKITNIVHRVEAYQMPSDQFFDLAKIIGDGRQL